LFDPESVLNPAAVAGLPAITATFNTSPQFRTVTSPEGSANLRDNRFPLASVGGPLGHYPFSFRISYSSYADHDFSVASTDTITLRGVPVAVADTLNSLGGLSDLGINGAWRAGHGWNLGGTFHVITGSNRADLRRHFSDTTYLPVRQQTELAYTGIGASVGLTKRMGLVSFAAMARWDGHTNVSRDTSATIYPVDLPYTFASGLIWRVRSKWLMAVQGIYQTWAGANSDLLAVGGLGSANTYQVSLGGEYVSNPRRPRGALRFGGHYGTLPFYLTPGFQPREAMASAGYGTRFGRGRAGVDFSTEYAWRWDNAGNKERALIFSFQISVTP
jgi:hypothetical protein